VLTGKVSKFSITFTLDSSPNYAPYPISGVLRDCHPSKSESVFQVALCSNDHNFFPGYQI
jgi:hypothetical protein